MTMQARTNGVMSKPQFTPQALAAGLHRKPGMFRPLREGESWHREIEDWQIDLLSEGWRPLLDGETGRYGDEYSHSSGLDWQTNGMFGTRACGFTTHTRTQRPLPEGLRYAYDTPR